MVLMQRAATLGAVRALEAELRKLPQVQIPAQLLIHGQMAARTIFIPAGTILTGVATKCDNISIAVGDITVTTDDGPQRLTGFHVLPAKAGAKRAGVAHADTWWTTVHHTALTDEAAIVEEMTDEPDALQTRGLLVQEGG
jgi:hypothetical protein